MMNRTADNEKLSALMDGELVDKALISELSQDRESQQTWRNYHLIGDVMRGDAIEKNWDIAASVALALEDEAPHSKHQQQRNDVEQRVVPIESQPAPDKARRRLPSWLAHLGQVSIAASVCLAVVLGIQQSNTEQQLSNDSQVVPVLQTVPLAGVAEPVSLTREPVSKSHSQTRVQEQRRRVNALLQDYELQLRLNGNANSHSEKVNSQESVVE